MTIFKDFNFDIDLHVTQMLIMALVLGVLAGLRLEGVYKLGPLAFIFLLPQMNIYTRAFSGYVALKRNKTPYLIVNELQVVIVTLICALIIYV